MSYIYDVLANFSECFFEFFDWNDDDNIVHIKRLPVLKVGFEFFNKVKYHDVIVSKDLLDKIYRKTDFFKIDKSKYSYVCSFCDGNEAIIINFSSDGHVLGRSSFLIDEEKAVLDLSECMIACNYDIVSLKENDYFVFKTRKEIFDSDYFINELKKMSEGKIRYLYYECFNEYENDVQKIFSRISCVLENNFSSICFKIDNFLKLTSFNK